MNNFKALLFIFFLGFYSVLNAQVQLLEEKIFFPGQAINKISIGSKGVWVIKGNDSLGLGKVDFNETTNDYTSQISSLINKPIQFIVGKYGDESLLSTDTELFWFNNGKISKYNPKTEIIGNKILGLEGDETYTKILTDSNLYTSFDNESFSLDLNYFNFSLQKPLKYLNTVLLYRRTSPSCSPEKNPIGVLFRAALGAQYSGEIVINPMTQINDFAVGSLEHDYPLYLYLAHPNGLVTHSFYSCSMRTEFLKDTATYCLKDIGDYMLIGTEKGLFYCPDQSPYLNNLINIPLSIGTAKIFSIGFDEANGFIWLGTDKGLLRYSFDNKIITQELGSTPLWTAKIGGAKRDFANDIKTDVNGDVIITGGYQGECTFGETRLISTNSIDYFLAKYSKDGKLKWLKTAINKGATGNILNEYGTKVTSDKNGNVYVHGYTLNYSETVDSSTITFENSSTTTRTWNSFIVKYDMNGNMLWKKIFKYTFDQDIIELETDISENLYIAFKLTNNNEFYLSEGYAILKLNKDGSQTWIKKYPHITKLKVTPTGNILIAGIFDYQLTIGNVTLTSNRQYTQYVACLDKNGDAIWGKYIKLTEFGNNEHIGSINGLSVDDAGYIYINGFKYGALQFDNILAPVTNVYQGQYTAKLNPSGKFIWAKRILNNENWSPSYSLTDKNGFTILSGTFTGKLEAANTIINSPDNGNGIYYLKIDPNGNLLWIKGMGGYSNPGGYTIPTGYSFPNYIPNSISIDKDNNIIGFINTDKNILFDGTLDKNLGSVDIFLFKLYDSLNTSNFNIVRGKIFNDKNLNNTAETGEEGLSGIMLKAQPGNTYSQTDEQGYYAFYFPKGNYSIQQVLTNKNGLLMSQNYPVNQGAYSVKLDKIKIDTSGFDFADKVILSPYLTVDINSNRRRRCAQGLTTVQYCNDGYVGANNVVVRVDYPEYIKPISSSIPWSAKYDNILLFNIGTLTPGTCKTITITDSVACGDQSIIGLTQCTKAYITPSNTVVPVNPNWDRSNMVINGKCGSNGFVGVVLKNDGAGDFSDSTQYKIFLDTIVVYSKKQKLESGDSISLNIPAKGKSLRVEANQNQYHPDNQMAVLDLEGCRNTNGSIASKAIVNLFNPHDEADEYEISCLPIVGSNDPNDKKVIPEGITDNHNVDENAELEYTLRFQNTGTDTAFTVVVNDTLSDLLDITTFKPGVTSHNGKWSVSGNGKPVITVKFDNIKLPDSTINETGSHGFAKFKISPLPNHKGEQVKNKAFIYFDFNLPVVTNEVFNTLGMPEFKEEAIKLQYCNKDVNNKNDSVFIHLCDLNQAQVNYVKNDTTFSVWQISKGSGIIAEVNEKTLISTIGTGENIYILNNYYCSKTWGNVVVANRYISPAAPSPVHISYCEDSKLDSVFVSGNDIKWYQDQNMSNQIWKGNKILPSYGENQTFYVNQTINDCESKVSEVTMEYKLRPEAPITKSNIYCIQELNKTVNAIGESITWYNDTISYNKVGTGNQFAANDLQSGQSLKVFATQTVNNCESKATPASIYIKPFNPEEIFIPNIINNTTDNYFYLPHFTSNECVGKFESVKIFDLNGKQVFCSKDENFQWRPSESNSKLFIYHIKFADEIYRGKIIVVDVK